MTVGGNYCGTSQSISDKPTGHSIATGLPAMTEAIMLNAGTILPLGPSQKSALLKLPWINPI